MANLPGIIGASGQDGISRRRVVMARNMMWNELEGQYRGQAEQGEGVTVAEDAMKLAHKRAGNWAFEADWWVETLTRALEHWGLFSKRWGDPATHAGRRRL